MSQAASQAATFYREVAEKRIVWTMDDEGGYPALKTRSGRRSMPFWSSKPRVRNSRSSTYRGRLPCAGRVAPDYANSLNRMRSTLQGHAWSPCQSRAPEISLSRRRAPPDSASHAGRVNPPPAHRRASRARFALRRRRRGASSAGRRCDRAPSPRRTLRSATSGGLS